MKLPNTLYVKIEKDGSTEYFVADESAAALVEMNETITLGKYSLVEIATAKGVAEIGPKRKRR